MKKYLLIVLIFLFISCGPTRRATTMDIEYQYRDSLLIEQIRYLMQTNVKIITDNSRHVEEEYYPDIDSSGKQKIKRRIIIDNNIKINDSTSIKTGDTIKVAGSSDMNERIRETIKEKRGLNWLQKILICAGVAGIIWLILFILKKTKILK